ncbi:MAG: carbohydrate binding family 9 domain-containing protein, partial [Gemmatimonadota bacterium]
MNPRWLPLLAALAATPSRGWAQRSEPSRLAALELATSVRIDGWLDDEAWRGAERITNFTQRELDVGAPATERTEVAVLFDADALYVGFWGFDSDPGGIRATEMARDFSWSSEDNFELVLDPFDDDRTGYLFVTNPNGARADALIADGGRSINRDWDGVWDARARVTDEGWFAEIRIPFSTLRFRGEAGRDWGVNFERNIRRKREQVLWQGWSRDFDLEQVSRAGSLAGLADLGAVRLVDVRPHGVAGVEWDEGEDRSSVGHLGLDVHYLPSPAWRVNFTVNPDFAQVESDREQVNLTRFSLFYP